MTLSTKWKQANKQTTSTTTRKTEVLRWQNLKMGGAQFPYYEMQRGPLKIWKTSEVLCFWGFKFGILIITTSFTLSKLKTIYKSLHIVHTVFFNLFNVTFYCSFKQYARNIIFHYLIRNQGSLKKQLTLGLWQDRSKISMKNLPVSEVHIHKYRENIKGTQKPAERSPYGLSLNGLKI